MISRELVKAAIEHRETDRVPYNIALTVEAREKLTVSQLNQNGCFQNDRRLPAVSIAALGRSEN